MCGWSDSATARSISNWRSGSVRNWHGASPEPFVLAILFGANFCYATPMAYQTNLMVMSAGGYRFSDFVRGGVPLTLLMLVCYAFLLPRFFPL